MKLQKHDEISSLVNGMSFVLNFAKDSSYTYREGEGKQMANQDSQSQNPQSIESSHVQIGHSGSKHKLLVSIGSGVSMIKVNMETGKFERVSGTMIGGGTLIGLSNLMTGITDFDEIIKESMKGNNQEVDMLVQDIYGESSPF